MVYNYEFTEKAKNDLDDILGYIVEELKNPQSAKKLLHEIHEKLNQISLFHNSGEYVRNKYISNLGIRKILVKNYIIYYLPKKISKTNIILRILHNKRDTSNIF